MRYFDTDRILFHSDVSAMNQNDLKAEIARLEEQLYSHQKLLDQAFSDNVEFAETKVLFHHVKMLSEKLQKLKNAVIPLSV